GINSSDPRICSGRGKWIIELLFHFFFLLHTYEIHFTTFRFLNASFKSYFGIAVKIYLLSKYFSGLSINDTSYLCAIIANATVPSIMANCFPTQFLFPMENGM